ncbi:helix-turn-helix transcriptional regulator [Rhodococcus sp. SGAir0479]|uniref:helix-turn-helix transcriptional regulator n=1 Tax=Rhodococcus sp. SGAir0479 TaxID=2567884 RepID=UPI0010CD11B4|nr:WYL domain-containing protein [Rhodococcus sp. SGAir0479]QCQ90688.1 WYL domain-containing transcriptional regulator [Rhodococcus sp. SGAir0479]
MSTATSRSLLLLSLLQARREWSGPVLAVRLAVSPRTVRRDVDRLREMGYRIVALKGPDGGYRLEAGSELPPLLFDDEQAVALALALQTVAATGADVGAAAERALATVRQVLPSRLRHRIGSVRITAVGDTGVAAGVDPAVLASLSAAASERVVLRFDYTTSAGRVERRRIEPHHVVTVSGRWYLVGWDCDRDDWRIFRADRIEPRVPTGPTFARRTLPSSDVRSFVSARFRGAAGDGSWPCVGEVILRLPAARVAPFVDAGTAVEDLGDGRCRMVGGSWSWESLAAATGRFDADIEVVAPPALRAAFATLAQRFAEAARSDGGGSPGDADDVTEPDRSGHEHVRVDPESR